MKDLLLHLAPAPHGHGRLRLAPAAAGAAPGDAAVLRGRDALVVLPTGAGKSAIYQVPGRCCPDRRVVISPLLALQQDQIAGLNARAGTRAECGADQLGGDAPPAGGGPERAARRPAPGFSSSPPSSWRGPSRLAADPRPAPGPRRGRRGALPVGLGPRLPAGLPDPGTALPPWRLGRGAWAA